MLAFCSAQPGFAQDQQSYPLASGEVVTGEPIHFNVQGAVLKRPDGSFSPRIAWTNFTEAALKQLGANSKAKPFVDQFLEPEDEGPAEAAQQLRTRPVPRLERPDFKAGLGALFASPLSITLLLLFWAANIYSAYEIAIFRNYPWPLVCGIAAVAPVLGPVIFLCLPTYIPGAEHAEELEPVEAHAGHEVPLAEHAAAAPASTSAYKVAAPAHSGPEPIIYKRGQITFNRRFFETKLANFMKMMPSDAEKDLVVEVKSSRGDHVGPRLARVLPNELYLQVKKGDASHEVAIPYNEISEVIVKHKDA